MWHCTKIYNTLNYELQKGKEEIHRIIVDYAIK